MGRSKQSPSWRTAARYSNRRDQSHPSADTSDRVTSRARNRRAHSSHGGGQGFKPPAVHCTAKIPSVISTGGDQAAGETRLDGDSRAAPADGRGGTTHGAHDEQQLGAASGCRPKPPGQGTAGRHSAAAALRPGRGAGTTAGAGRGASAALPGSDGMAGTGSPAAGSDGGTAGTTGPGNGRPPGTAPHAAGRSGGGGGTRAGPASGRRSSARPGGRCVAGRPARGREAGAWPGGRRGHDAARRSGPMLGGSDGGRRRWWPPDLSRATGRKRDGGAARAAGRDGAADAGGAAGRGRSTGDDRRPGLRDGRQATGGRNGRARPGRQNAAQLGAGLGRPGDRRGTVGGTVNRRRADGGRTRTARGAEAPPRSDGARRPPGTVPHDRRTAGAVRAAGGAPRRRREYGGGPGRRTAGRRRRSAEYAGKRRGSRRAPAAQLSQSTIVVTKAGGCHQGHRLASAERSSGPRCSSAVHPGFPLEPAQHVVAEEVSAPVEQFTHLRVTAPAVRGRMPALH